MLPKHSPTRTRIDGLTEIEKPCENSGRVRLDDWDGLIKGETGHRMCRVFSDARESLYPFDRARKSSTMVL
jgi:hypothetical protein